MEISLGMCPSGSSICSISDLLYPHPYHPEKEKKETSGRERTARELAENENADDITENAENMTETADDSTEDTEDMTQTTDDHTEDAVSEEKITDTEETGE